MERHFDLAPDEWATLRCLLDEALDLPVGKRDAWLDRLSGDDAGFKPRLRALLAHAEGTAVERLLHTLPKIETGTFAGRPDEDGDAAAESGQHVGPYRLLREIGEGGMASVWLAERSDVLQRRQVALKLPHGTWRRAAWAARLAREREILATLEHPNIARLYDAGVAADGQPYLALEYVEGQRIDAHCGERGLDARQRLGLFMQVAHAVAHAHARLVVHRDLKPSNILVTAEGQVRLLDFGIAKLLEQGLAQATELTLETGRALTPDYAAPEQIRGEAIGTAADIYSLGVVLFELLAGERPYKLNRASRAALEEAILKAEPPRPSDVVSDPKLRKQLRGDLDTIVLKALKKVPAERYTTVDALAADIERWLRQWPVLAQPDSRWYRARKFIARNKLQVGATAGVLIAVLAGSGVALWQLIEANQQRDTAIEHQRRAESFSEFMYVLLDDLGPGGRPLTMSELLDHAAATLERQHGLDPSLSAYMQYEISRKYAMVNQTQRVLTLLERAAAGARSSGDANLLAAVQCAAAWSLGERDRARAEAKLAEAERVLAAARDVSVFTTADCLRARARILQGKGHVDGAITALQEGLRLLDGSRVQAGSRRRLLNAQLSDLYRAADRFKEALVLSGQELDSLQRSGRGDSMAVYVARSNHAGNFFRLGEVTRAAALQAENYDWMLRREASGMDPLGFRTNYGFTLLRLGDAQRALQLADQELHQTRHAGNVARTALCELLAARASVQLRRLDEADSRLRAAEAVWRADAKFYARMLQEAALTRADMLLQSGRVEDARLVIEAALARAGYPGRDTTAGLDRLLRLGARIHLQAKDTATAERLAGAAMEVSRRIARDERQSADVGEAAWLRAQARVASGRNDTAVPDAALASEALRNGLGSEHPLAVEATSLLARLRSS